MAKKSDSEYLPEVVELSDEQVHHICSYNHYHIKEESEKQGHSHQDIYDTDELTHEYEYGINEDIVKSEKFMADIKKMDQDDSIENEKFKFEYYNFPM